MKNTRKLAKTKKIFFRLMIITFLFLIFWWLYGMYAKIEVSDSMQGDSEYTAEKTGITVTEVKENSKTISDTIEEANKAVVGISKIKNMGTSIA